MSTVLDRIAEVARHALNEARRTLQVDHPVRDHVEAALREIDYLINLAASSPTHERTPAPKAPSPSEMDCMKWAVSFVEHVRWRPSIATDEGTMMAWFATAIMAGFDDAQRRRDREAYEFIGWLSGDIPELHGVEIPRLGDAYKRFINTRDPDSAESKVLAASPVSSDAKPAWEPISTAKEDGGIVLVFDQGATFRALIENGQWIDVECDQPVVPPPTHWFNMRGMPLPASPSPTKQE